MGYGTSICLRTGWLNLYPSRTPWRDGTTHVVLDPLDFIARLAALVPPPRAIGRSLEVKVA